MYAMCNPGAKRNVGQGHCPGPFSCSPIKLNPVDKYDKATQSSDNQIVIVHPFMNPSSEMNVNILELLYIYIFIIPYVKTLYFDWLFLAP